MKHHIKFIKILLRVLFIFVSFKSFSQNNSGIFLSAADFKSGKLTLSINCDTEKHRIKFNDFFDKSYIDVKHHGRITKYEKKDVFGFRECGDKNYRFIKNRHYIIVNPKEPILIYQEVIHPVAKNPGKTIFHFSKDAESEIELLTLQNLKAAFPDNHKFHDALDAEISSDLKLADYDTYHKMFKINHIYQTSLQ